MEHRKTQMFGAMLTVYQRMSFVSHRKGIDEILYINDNIDQDF